MIKTVYQEDEGTLQGSTKSFRLKQEEGICTECHEDYQ